MSAKKINFERENFRAKTDASFSILDNNRSFINGSQLNLLDESLEEIK